MSNLLNPFDIGVNNESSAQNRRAVVLSNYIALILSLACLMIFVIIPQNHSLSGFLELSTGALIFSIAILLNYFAFTMASRIYLCWLPPILLMWYTTINMRELDVISVSSYDGLRFYLLALSCIPYLLMDSSKITFFIAGVFPGLVCTVFCDYFLNLAGVGYDFKGIADSGYALTPIRVFISYMILSASSFSLNLIIVKSDQLNQKLLAELAEKNRKIQEQAETEVFQLNDQLKLNLQQLSEREFILNQSQRIAKVGSWEYRIENNFLFWSDAMFEIFGLDKSYSPIAGHMKDALGEEGSERISNATTTLLKTGQPFDTIIRVKTPIGYTKWFRVYAYPIIEGNNAIGVRGICHDITFFKEAEEKLRAGEAKFSKVFENYPDFIMVVRETDLMVIDVNQRIKDVLGFTKDEVIGRTARTMNLFLSEESRQHYIEEYSIDGYTEFECPWRRKDGRIIQVKITGIRINIEGSNYRMSVVQDITERKAAEEKFINAFNLSPDLMIIIREKDLVIVEVNQKIEELFGFTRTEAIGKSPQQEGFALWSKQEDRSAFFQEYQLKGKVFVESELRKKNGEQFFATVSTQRISLSGEYHMIVVVRDITERKQIEKEKEFARHQLNERIKELTTLYRVSQILHDEHKSLHEMLWEIVTILPAAYQYPEITIARINLGGEIFGVQDFENTNLNQIAKFEIPSDLTGILEVAYKEDRPFETEGPFLAEERDLINMIAKMLEEHLARKHEQESLVKSQANLNATINNTEVLIWSVDRNFKLIMFNNPFANYIRQYYGVEISAGNKVIPNPNSDEDKNQKWWEYNYLKALAGELVILEEKRFGFDFQFSLCPIIEDDIITGVSVFADNVTTRKNQDRDLAEANKKIGELKLMALRSVMSPHFIFNVLNSIQFFITKNDRLNAITYLSTFSKLIRSILTHSVNNKIRLTDEIEMLKNYVQLEMVRFENKFNFILNVDSNVDVESIEIPSLLIQPYVENAILHGLYNKQDIGTLKIDIYEENDTIIFQIEDDGIGREAAKKIREQNFPTHKSMGIKLTEERLQLINQKHNVVFEIIDLVNESGPCGTRVRIGVIY